jgi:hypothetical protein
VTLNLEIFWPTFLIALCGVLIGTAAKVSVQRTVTFPNSLGLTMGIGLAVAMVAIALSHQLLHSAQVLILPLLIFSFLIVVWSIWRQSTKVWIFCSWTDLVAFAASLFLLFPMLKFGLTAWTAGTHDFPSYASSAQIWMTSATAFLELHPDNFGTLQLDRASFEKPMTTSLLVLASWITSVPSYQLLSPLMLISAFLLISSLLTVANYVCRLNIFLSSLVVLLPTYSIIPVSRIHDAQLGQVLAVSLFVCTAALFLTISNKKFRGGAASTSLIIAIVAAAALGSNLTLILGSALAMVGTLYWLFFWQSDRLTQNIQISIISLFFILMISSPFYDMYFRSFMGQSNGIPGFPIPFPSVFSLIGNQFELKSVSYLMQELLYWSIFIASIILYIYYKKIHHSNFVLIVFILLNFTLIALVTGIENYAVHKWIAFSIPLVIPLVFSRAVSGVDARAKLFLMVLMTPLVCSAGFIVFINGEKITMHISKDLLALKENAALANESTLNIELENIQENSIAALIVPSRTVNVTGITYAPPTPPRKGNVLVRSDSRELEEYINIKPLNNTYSLASYDLSMAQKTIIFGTEHPESKKYLFGNWHPAEPSRVWSSRGDSFVVFDLPADIGAGDVHIDLYGNAYSTKSEPQTLRVFANGELLETHEYRGNNPEKIDLVVPQRLVDAAQRRITINLKTLASLTPATSGSLDTRVLGFSLHRIELKD